MHWVDVPQNIQFKNKFMRLSKKMTYGVFADVSKAFVEYTTDITKQGVRLNGTMTWDERKLSPDKIKMATTDNFCKGILYMETDKVYFLTPWFMMNNHGLFGYHIDDISQRVVLGFLEGSKLKPFATYMLGSYCIVGHTNMHLLVYSYRDEKFMLLPYTTEGRLGHVQINEDKGLTFPLTVL